MKYLFFLSYVLVICCGFSQGVRHLNVDQIKIESQNALKQSSIPKIEAVIQKAFQSKDVDVIAACFSILGNHIGFSEMLESAEPPEFKNQLILAILRQPWMTDIDSHGLPPSGSFGPPTIHYICIKQIKPYLPDENLDANINALIMRLDDRKERERLATLFEAALKRSEGASSKAKDEPSAIHEDEKSPRTWWIAVIGVICLMAGLGKFFRRKNK